VRDKDLFVPRRAPLSFTLRKVFSLSVLRFRQLLLPILLLYPLHSFLNIVLNGKQGDQMSLLNNRATHFCQNYCITLTVEKWTAAVTFQKLPKVNNRPMGEHTFGRN
jgi:hypothetical protein